MILETERLLLRPFTAEDGAGLYQYLSDEAVVAFEPYRPFSREAAEAEAQRRSKDKSFTAVCLKNGELIGNLYFAEGEFHTWELGYVFARAYWGKGFACEAVRALLHQVFRQPDVHRVTAFCDPLNSASWKLLERVGMRREGHFIQNVYFFEDEAGIPLWKDTYAYALLRTEYERNSTGMEANAILKSLSKETLAKLAQQTDSQAVLFCVKEQGISITKAEAEVLFAALYPLRGQAELDDETLEVVLGGIVARPTVRPPSPKNKDNPI